MVLGIINITGIDMNGHLGCRVNGVGFYKNIICSVAMPDDATASPRTHSNNDYYQYTQQYTLILTLEH